jgi:hypothetical protein
MQRLLRAVCAALFVALPGVARAQGAQSTVQLDDPSPAGWDASGHVAWLTVDKTGIAPEWNRWYDVAAFGGSLGRFFGPHLRVEVDAATSAFAELYVTRQVAVPGQPSPIYLSEMHRYQMATVGGGAIWTLNQGDGTVSRVDVKTRTLVTNIALGAPGGGGEMAYGEGYVWATVFEIPLTQIDPKTNTVIKQWMGVGGDAVRVGHGSVWLSNLRQQNLWRIDPTQP